MNEARRRLGVLQWVVVAAATLHVVGVAAMLVSAEKLLRPAMNDEALLRALSIAIPLNDLVLAVVFGVSARSAFTKQPGTPGKLRALLLGAVGVVHFPLIAAALGIFLKVLLSAGASRLATFLSPFSVLYMLEPDQASTLTTLGQVALVSALPMLPLLVSHWFVLPERPRRIFFFGFDIVLAVVFVYALAKLPISPIEGESKTKLLASARHLISALFAIRLFVRVLPFGFDAFERISVHTLIAARHLRSKRSNFLSAISFLTILSVTASTCLLSSVLSVMGGFRADLEGKILGNSAHVVVDRQSGTFEGWADTQRRIASTPGVVAVSPYVQAEVMITSSSNLQGALLRGIDPRAAAAVNALERNLTTDRRRARGSLALLADPRRIDAMTTSQRCPDTNNDYLLDPADVASSKPPSEETDENQLAGILIGRELAKSLRLCVGDDLEVVSPLGELGPAGPIPSKRRFRVAGIFYSGMYEYDMKHVYVLLPIARSFLRAGDTLSGFDIRARNVDAAPALARTIRAGLGRDDLRVQDWRERNQSLFGALALEKLLIFITLGITVLIAGFCVFATLTLMVQEKRQDVGILKAMGSPDSSIISVFLAEGLLIGVIGAASGLGFGWIAAFAAEHFGIAMNPGVFYIDRLPVRVDAIEFLSVGLSAAIVCVLATIGPAMFASRMRPLDAIRED